MKSVCVGGCLCTSQRSSACLAVPRACLTSSVSNMVRLEEKGELVLSPMSHGLSNDMVARSRAKQPSPPPGPETRASPPLTRTDSLGGARDRVGERERESG